MLHDRDDAHNDHNAHGVALASSNLPTYKYEKYLK